MGETKSVGYLNDTQYILYNDLQVYSLLKCILTEKLTNRSKRVLQIRPHINNMFKLLFGLNIQ
jgi:hypothetical protein